MKDSFFFLGSSSAAQILEKQYGACDRSLIYAGSGKQVYTDGALSLVFEGDIYSYADPFLPCDSCEEYILAAYRSHGENMFNSFEGKFTLALFDAEKNCAYFARDHFGGMPLYYSFGEGFVVASSKPSPIANCALIKKELSLAGLCHYFSLRFIPAPDTIFENVRALMAGH